MKAFRAGIIGLGVGEQHIPPYLAHPDCEVAALCDFSPAKRQEVAARYPDLRMVERDQEILQDPSINVVSIASYDDMHHRQIVAALKAEKHVFVEKPLCLRREEAEEIREHLRRRPHLRLSSNLILRKSPRFRGLKQMVADGVLGTTYLIEGDYNYGRLKKITEGWRGDQEYYSVLHGGAIHMVDLVLWLAQDRVAEVAAFGNNISTAGTKFRFNDVALGILRFENGVVAKISANFGCVYPHFHRFSLYGTSATFENGIDCARLFLARDPDAPPRRIETPYPGTGKGELVADFVAALAEGRQPEVGIDETFDTMSVCLALEQAMQTGAVTRVRYL